MSETPLQTPDAPVPPPLPVAPPSLPDDAAISPRSLPKTIEVANMTVAEFLDWIVTEKLKAFSGINIKALYVNMLQRATDAGLRDTIIAAGEEKIGSPDALNLETIETTYLSIATLYAELQESDGNGNRIILPSLGRQELIAELEAFSLTVAPPPAPAAEPAQPAAPEQPVSIAPAPEPPAPPAPERDPAVPQEDTVPPGQSPGDAPAGKMSGLKKAVIATGLAVAAAGAAYGANHFYGHKLFGGSADQPGATRPTGSGDAASEAKTSGTAQAPSTDSSAPVETSTPAPEETASPAPTPEDPSPEPTLVIEIPSPSQDHPLAGLQKITLLCTYDSTVPKDCRFAEPSIIPFTDGCMLKTVSWKPIELNCVDAKGYQGPVWQTPYDADDRDLWSGPSTGENVVVTLRKVQ